MVRHFAEVCFLFAGLVVAGCGGANEPGEEGSAGGEAAYAGPIGSTDVALGQERFVAVCGGCHGAQGEGGENAPRIAAMRWTTAQMRRQIREGDDHMRPISETRLSSEHMEAVLAYLVTLEALVP